MKKYLPLLVSVCIAFMLLAAIPLSQPAAPNNVFNANDTSDLVDTNPGNGFCGTTYKTCTLRAAVMESNLNPGPDTINLDYSTYTITLSGQGEDNASTGDLDIKDDVTINGKGINDTTIDANSLDRIFHVFSGSHLTLTNLTIRNGSLPSGNQGGAIYVAGNLSLSNVKITNNSISGTDTNDRGGGIILAGTHITRTLLTMDGSTLSQNSAQEGGGIYANGYSDAIISDSQFLSNTSPSGGGIHTYNGAAITITNSLFYTNTASAGGGILNNGRLNITNVTFSQNNANGGAGGGGLLNLGHANLLNVTIYGSPGGTGLSNTLWMTMTNSILADNLPGNCNINWAINSGGYNVTDDVWCNLASTGDLQNKDPQLSSLADNGGPTRTHALQINSPAIDRVTAGICPSQDQRGTTRPIDGNGDGIAYCDSGAYEHGEVMNVYLPVILR